MEKKIAQVDLVARVDGLEELGGAIEEVAGHPLAERIAKALAGDLLECSHVELDLDVSLGHHLTSLSRWNLPGGRYRTNYQ